MRLRIRALLAEVNKKRQQNQKAFKRNPVGVFSGARESPPCNNIHAFAYSRFAGWGEQKTAKPKSV
ncbi:hypothetical protein CG427_02690 [Pantoea ananatis]|nr:hypothetical protein CG430_16615 [Pantoea ananatis]PQK78342.1 hypothetical protein CG427_02690 [Pantoea ananatis]